MMFGHLCCRVALGREVEVRTYEDVSPFFRDGWPPQHTRSCGPMTRFACGSSEAASKALTQMDISTASAPRGRAPS